MDAQMKKGMVEECSLSLRDPMIGDARSPITFTNAMIVPTIFAL